MSKLEDLKKLKVPELKSRLKKLGLDSRGLKAELVGRLWSAVDTVVVSTQEENYTLLHDHERIRTEAVSPPAESHRQYTETGTQTEDLQQSRTEDLQQPRTEDLQQPGTEDLQQSRTDDLQQSRTEDLQQSGTEDLQQSGTEDLQQPGTEDLQQPGTEDLQQPGTEDLQQPVTEDLQQPRTEDLQQPRTEDLQQPRTDDLQQSGTEDLQQPRTEDLQQPRTEDLQQSRTDDLQQSGTEDLQQPGTEEQAEAVEGDVHDTGKGRAFYEFKEEIKYKRSKLPPVSVTEEPMEDDKTVRIDSYNSHLHFGVEPDGTSGHPLLWERFPLLWSGCRLTHGVQRNRVGFEVKLERLLTSQQNPPDVESFGLRVGWSVANASLFLGKDYLSFAYDGRGKKVSVGKEEDYGEFLSVGDIIGCYATFSTGGSVELSFHKNGLFLGVAYTIDASMLQGQPLFPHVLCRGCSVRFLLDPMAPACYTPSGFTPLGSLPDEEKICAFSAPSSKSQCEVIVMVGFPGSGKTHWAKKHIKQHPEKHYKLLSTEELLECTVKGGESDVRLHQAAQYLTELIKLAAQRPGNYILDQCNILFSARNYKLQLFVGFRRKVVVIFPTKKEWNKRLSKHQQKEGEHIPQMSLLKLQISCTLPQQDDSMEELQFVELTQKQSQTMLQEYKDEARSLLPTPPKQNENKLQRIKKRPYPHGQASSCKAKCTCHSWSYLPSWSQQQHYWPVTSQHGYYYNSSYDGCW